MKSICFITTGNIKNIATAKRALGLANPLSDLGWKVYIIMEDTTENRHRCSLECDSRVNIYYLRYKNAFDEQKKKNRLINQINPSIVYICAFVFRNIVQTPPKCIKLVEHSELQSGIPEIKNIHKIRAYFQEFYSIIYADGLLNASKYLEKVFEKRAKKVYKKNMPMLYFPYAYNKNVCYIDNETDRLYHKKPNEKLFVFLGSLDFNYGAMTMVEAFEKVKNIIPNAKLLLCGQGRAYNHVCNYIKQHNLEDTISTTGYIKEEDIAGYFTLADAFISPMINTIQDWARCPSKLYMYLPYQKPIITCKIGEPFELLKEDGIYFDPGNSDSLKKCIIQLMENNYWNFPIVPSLHEWRTRAIQLNEWLNNCFILTSNN